MKKLTQEEFIQKARAVHGDKYDYSKVEYVNSSTKVIIICPIHGQFKQSPHDHLSGYGCPHCQHKAQELLYQKLKDIYPQEIVVYEANKKNYSVDFRTKN